MTWIPKVYLDSQDYSVLSSGRITAPLAIVKRRLLEFASTGSVQFYFSAVVVCEAAPTGPQAVNFAIQRADILSRLCGRNSLVDAATLMKREILSLASSSGTPLPHPLGGDWFPHFEIEESLSAQSIVSDVIAEEARGMGLTRQQRRAAERRIKKKGGLRSSAREPMTAGYAARADEFCKKYPIKREFYDVLTGFSLGSGGRERVEHALRESLKDPSWLMRWFAVNPSHALPLSEMVRSPGRSVGAQSRHYVESMIALRDEILASNMSPEAEELLSKLNWKATADSMLVQLVERLAKLDAVDLHPPITAEIVSARCPGLDAVVRSLASSVWDNISGARKEAPSDSQFPDAMHAIYAPYVDFFRADAFMAPHIRRQVERHGTKVVSKLVQLPDAIEHKLEARRY